jgi:hypothetical protein
MSVKRAGRISLALLILLLVPGLLCLLCPCPLTGRDSGGEAVTPMPAAMPTGTATPTAARPGGGEAATPPTLFRDGQEEGGHGSR